MHSHAERGNEKKRSRSHALRGNACLDAPRPATRDATTPQTQNP